MPKGWAAWPRSARWLVGGIAAVVLALAVTWVLFVPAADWLAHHDVGSASGSLRETALDNARGRLLTLGAGLFAGGALLFTARNFTLSREGQVTDRYTKAIEQLGSEKLDVRIGGIYALERIARDSARDHPTVMEVLTAFILEHSHERWPLPEHDPDSAPSREMRPDIQAALTVVSRRDRKRDIRLLKLNGADLTGADLYGLDFSRTLLVGVNFTGARLGRTDFSNATLMGANFSGVDSLGANFTGAYLYGVRWPQHGQVPEGWRLNTDSGRLEPAGTNSGYADAKRPPRGGPQKEA